MRVSFKDRNKYGWWSYFEDDTFYIGEKWPCTDKMLYHGKYLGDNTPYLMALKESEPKQYFRIIDYFENHPSDSKSLEISVSEKFTLKNRILEIMRASVTDEYSSRILRLKHPNTHRPFMDDVVEAVLVNSDWETEHFYCDTDIRLAIGRVLINRLNLNIKQ